MIKQCLCGLSYKKVRTILIIISIAVGVFSVTVTQVIATTGSNYVNGELDALGISGICISKSTSPDADKLTNTDLENLKRQNFVDSATPIMMQTAYTKSESLPSVVLCGIGENAESIISLKILSGYTVSEKNIQKKDNVCLIDEQTAKTLFGTNNATGRKISMFFGGESENFTVIGIVKVGSSLLQGTIGDMLPTVIYVPFTALQKKLGDDKLDQIALHLSVNADESEAITKITNLISSDQPIKINDLNSQRSSLNDLLSKLTVFLELFGGISMLVAGIGIMTVMLISVNEKKKEIGIKKAIGATKFQIMLEFLFESAFLALLGAIFGICFAIIGSGAAQKAFKIDIALSFSGIFRIFAISILCGIIFGVYPAIKAAKTPILEALKNE